MTLSTATQLPPTPAQVPSQLPPNPTIPEVTHPFQETISPNSSIDRPNDDARPQTHDVPRPHLSLQDTFDLQLQVLEKLNTVCDTIKILLDHYITTLPRPPTNPCRIMPDCMSPVTISNVPRLSILLMEPTSAIVPMNPCTALVSEKLPPTCIISRPNLLIIMTVATQRRSEQRIGCTHPNRSNNCCQPKPEQN